MCNNPNLTGEYTELREKVLKMLDLGLTKTAFGKACGEPNSANSSILRWVAGNRPLNHGKVKIVEEAIENIKKQFSEI